nr:Chain C, Insulin [Homo sapiens]3UTS_C Chain C, Insulin [Homo sapiens]3UTS_H Chain H, Insulin [Homo sapiens]3UTT_C Chain C, Insulin [Homo sapiens]3UTT_H Chain H, Insulin [Homo sapiens]
ALWGPDPAAA